jgi:hypothetical protein
MDRFWPQGQNRSNELTREKASKEGGVTGKPMLANI